MKTRTGRLAILLLTLLAAVGCADSPTPPPTDGYVFTPSAADVTVLYQGQITFAVRTAAGEPVTVDFRRGDTFVASGISYTYTAGQAGQDSLWAVVAGGDGVAKRWRIWVESGYGDRPAPVQGLIAVIGARPGTLLMNWLRASPALNPLPVARYHVALGFAGPLTELNWDAAQQLATVPSLESIVGYAYAATGLDGGGMVWVGVRAEDTAGRLSPLGLVPQVRVAAAYRITGLVADLAGNPLEGISVVAGEAPELRAITASGGLFTLPRPDIVPEGFRDIDRYVLTLRDEIGLEKGLYYDVRTDTLSAADTYPRQLLLVAARTAQGDPILDASCAAPLYAGEFLTFLKNMTNCGSGGNTRLFRWDHYPVRYWAQSTADWLTTGGFSMGPLVRAAAAAWNVRTGMDMFEATTDSVAADLKIVFNDGDEGIHGFTEIVEPPYTAINTVIPIKMKIRLDRSFAILDYAKGVVLHEFGHALCVGNHSECGDMHIMCYGAHDVPLSSAAPDTVTQLQMEAAISDDEVRLMQCVRRLTQGVNLNQYLLD